MTPSSLSRSLARLLMLFVAAVSGTYLVVYLYRWEWNRALISGLFFLAAEVAYVGSSLRAEIRGLRARIDALEATPDGNGRAQPDTAAARPARPFGWLRDSASQTNVFVPVLLGAGVILSALAFVVERVAGIVARSLGDRSIARRPFALQPPSDGLLGTVPESRPTDRERARRLTWGLGGRLIAVLVLVLSVAVAVDRLADATQSRPSPRVPGSSTVVELRIDQRDPRPAIEAAQALAVACHGSLRADSEFTNLVTLRGDNVQLEVTPALSELQRRRLFGCLEDATLDRVQAHVVGWTTTPEAAPIDPDEIATGAIS
jgi:hypothetical protein